VNKSVLLVDDDPVFVDAVSAVLESRYEVRCAANGSEALAAVRSSPPDAVILDVMMDHLSEGFDVARALKSDEATRHIPVIMLTGVDEVFNLRMEIDEKWLPYDRYLEKPVAPQKLLATLDELLR
jgi:CheY-like chemotaxis protein